MPEPERAFGMKVETVSQTCFEPLWDRLVKEHHYLSYHNLLGRRLKYLAFIGEQPAAALSFSAPALKLRARDRFIGWSDEQRKVFLGRMVSNSRFLIGILVVGEIKQALDKRLGRNVALASAYNLLHRHD